MQSLARAFRALGFSALSAMTASKVAFANSYSAATSTAADGLADVCASGVEGSYLGRDARGTEFRLNLICVESDRMIAGLGILHVPSQRDLGLYAGPQASRAAASQNRRLTGTPPTVGTGGVVGLFAENYSGVYVEDGQLLLTGFQAHYEDRRNVSSKVRANWLRLDLAALRRGSLQGQISAAYLTRTLALTGQRQQSFPSLPATAPSAARDFAGTYAFRSFSGPAEILLDVFLGAPVARIGFGEAGAAVVSMVDSPRWAGDGLFSAAVSTGDGELDAAAMTYVRGRALDRERVEFVYVDSYNGIRGPYIGTKVHTP